MSISAESTTGEDITADQEYLGPTFSNLEPSEELRLLRARIAELERQQSINSPTSSVSFNLLEAAANDRGKIAAEYGGGNESAAAKEGQQTNTDPLKKELRAEMKEYQKEQQLNIVHLQKTGATMREIGLINRWNSAACHPSLALIGPDRMIVQQYGEKNGAGSVIAEKAMPENRYFEVKVLEETTGTIHIGLATKQMPLDEWVGIYEGTYAFECYRGNLVIVADDGGVSTTEMLLVGVCGSSDGTMPSTDGRRWHSSTLSSGTCIYKTKRD